MSFAIFNYLINVGVMVENVKLFDVFVDVRKEMLACPSKFGVSVMFSSLLLIASSQGRVLCGMRCTVISGQS